MLRDICGNIKLFLMCVNWCAVVLSGRDSLGCWRSALGRAIVQGELEPNPTGARVLCVCVFIPGRSGSDSKGVGFV